MAAVTKTDRLRLSDILREAKTPPVADVSAQPAGPLATSAITAATPTPSRAKPPEAEQPFPALLERIRDPRTDPYIDLMPEAARSDDVDQKFKELDSLPPARDPLTDMGPTEYVEAPPTRERRFGSDAPNRAPWKVPAVLLMAVAVAGFILSLSGWILTAEDEATDVNERIAAQLTEIDLYLATNEAAIRETEAGEGGRVVLPDYPLPVTLSEDEAANLETAELRRVILDRAATLTYQEGVSAYGTSFGLFDDFSTPGAVRAGIEFMQDSNHSRLLLLTLAFAVFVLVGAAVVAAATTGSGRLTALGLSLLLGGVAAFAISLLMRLALEGAAGGDDSLSDGLGDLATDASFLFIRNSLAFVVAGVLTTIAGAVVSFLDRQSDQEMQHLESEPIPARR